MSRLRQELPPEILENVLARLPVHVLCRFRLVCKGWNHRITQLGFASCHAQALRKPYVLISPKVLNFDPHTIEKTKEMQDWGLNLPDSLVKMATKREWKILDMAEKRLYTLSDFPIEAYLWKGGDKYCGWDRYTLAADGGLIYALYHGGGIRRHIVYNPMGKNWHQIPKPKLRCRYDYDIVVMSVDNATQSYKIITMESKHEVRSRPEKVYLYDSTTTQWRMLCEMPANYRAWSSVFLKGVFYTLFVDTSVVTWCPKLYSCDLETGAWSDIDVELPRPSHLQDKSQLVVSLGRLFFVEYTGVPAFNPYGHLRVTAWETQVANNNVRNKQLIKVSISEILLAEKEVMKVAEMPKYSKYPRRMFDRPQYVIGNPVVAVGCGDSIVISSLLRRRLGFDLVRNCWEELPEDTGHMYETNRQLNYDRQGIYAGILDLDLREMGELRVTEEVTVSDHSEVSDSEGSDSDLGWLGGWSDSDSGSD